MRSRADFTSMLDELREEQAAQQARAGGRDAQPQPDDSPRPNRPAAGFYIKTEDRGASASPRGVFAAYEFFQQVVRTRRQKTLNDEVAGELRISASTSIAHLKKLRRSYAFAHHPDRVRPARRGDASERMSLANMMIDAEIRRRKR